MFCILFLLDLLDLTLFNLSDVGEPLVDVPEGETIFETPVGADFEWGASDVVDHLANWGRHLFDRLFVVVDF